MSAATPIKIAWVAPASPMGSHADVAAAKQWVESRYPCEIIYTEACYQSQSVEQRVEQLLQCALDPEIDGLWAVRGGEGSADLMPDLMAKRGALQALQHKWLLGFSDITALLFFFSQHCQWQVVHGPCVNGFVSGGLNERSMASMQAWLHQQPCEVRWDDLQPLNTLAAHTDKLSVPIVAGNLTVVNFSVKDCWELSSAGRIVVLEDVNEHPYAIARTLKYLQRVGVFEGAAALVLGSFTQHQQSLSPLADVMTPNLLPRLTQFAQSCDCPVFTSSQVGHGTENLPVLFDAVATVKALDGKASLSYTLIR